MATNFMDFSKKHVIAESSLLKATITGRIVNLVLEDADIDNGKLVVKGEYLRPEVYAAVKPTETDKVYLTLQVPLIYEEYTPACQSEYNFFNAKGDVIRCYPLEQDDIFTVSENGIKALGDVPVKGNLVVANGFDITEVAADTDVANVGFAGRIIEKVARSGGNFYQIEVIKNEKM